MKKWLILNASIAMTFSFTTISMAAEQVGTVNSQAAQNEISLEQAIDIGNRSLKGDLVSVEFDQNDSSANGIYDIKIIASNIEYEVTIDAVTGEMLNAEQSELDADDMSEYNTMKKAQISLSEAIQKATRVVDGKVVTAGFDIEYDKPVYKIQIVTGAELHEMVIDSMTGNILNNRVESDDDIDD